MNKLCTLFLLIIGLLTVDCVMGQEMVLVKGDLNSNQIDASEYVDNQLFFIDDTGNNADLWVTDGTEEGTEKLLENNVSLVNGKTYLYMGSYQGMLYFAGTDAEHGAEVWRSDGTVEGTQLFADLAEGTNSSYPAGFVELNGQLYIWACIKKDNGTTISQIWRTDGTNVEMIKEISVCETEFGSNMDDKFNLQSYSVNEEAVLFFLGETGDFGTSTYSCLWKTDGTSEGTVMVTETSGSIKGPHSLVAADNNISYFLGAALFDNLLSYRIWRTDGTPSGTFAFNMTDNTQDRTVVGSSLFYVREPSFSEPELDNELWMLDDENEAVLVKTVPNDAYLYSDLVGYKNKLFFTFEDEEHGTELWMSNGSETNFFVDINVGEGDSNPRNSIVVGDYLYFIANYDEENSGLYQMEMVGGGEGIVKQMVDFAMFDIKDVEELLAFGEDLFVIARNENNKSQLWHFNNPLIDNIEEADLKSMVRIVPNPFIEQTFLSFSKSFSANISLQLYNSIGQKVDIMYEKTNEGLLLKRGNLKMGMYFFEVKENEEVIGNGKLMIDN